MVQRVYALLEQHRQSVYRYALSLTRDVEMAEDLAQECMLAACKNLEALNEVRSIQSWLFRVARNRWVDHCRKRKPPFVDSADIDQLVSSLSAEPPQAMSEQEQISSMMAEMMALPDRQREVIYLHVVEQMTANQIADALELSKAGVKSNLCAARQTLRRKLMPRSQRQSNQLDQPNDEPSEIDSCETTIE